MLRAFLRFVFFFVVVHITISVRLITQKTYVVLCSLIVLYFVRKLVKFVKHVRLTRVH